MPAEAHIVRWIELLGSANAADREAARVALHTSGTKAVPLLLGSLTHPYWRVRRGCLRVLDHQPLTRAIVEQLIGMLRDSHRKVREAAVHTLACEGCKPDACESDLPDILPVVIDRAINDPSSTVRRQAVGALVINRSDARAAEALTRILNDERNTRVLRIAWFVHPPSERRQLLNELATVSRVAV